MKKKTTLNFALAMCSEQRVNVNKVSNGTTMITTTTILKRKKKRKKKEREGERKKK